MSAFAAAEDASESSASWLEAPAGNNDASSSLLNPSTPNHKRAGSIGNSVFYDNNDGLDAASTSSDVVDNDAVKAIDQVRAKIERTKELIAKEQASRDSNVNEYLKLSSNASGQIQMARIKQVFEKKNQKSAQNIVHYQRKLDEYQKKLFRLQEHGVQLKQTQKLGKGLMSVGNNLRDMSNSVMAKPKEFAAHVLRQKRFGSADNLAMESGGDAMTTAQTTSSKAKAKQGSASLPRENSGLSSSFDKRKCISDDGRRSDNDSHSRATSTSGAARTRPDDEDDDDNEEDDDDEDVDEEEEERPSRLPTDEAEWAAVMEELALHREEAHQLREALDDLRMHFKREIEALNEQLRDERDRHDRFEEQINDLTELHQHEIENVKSGVTDMEEKVQYQSEERLLDVKEHLQSLETKVTSMEHQAAQQHINIEGLAGDSTDARAVLMKLLTALITVVHVCLFLVGTCMSLARPFLSSTRRAAVTAVIVALATLAYYKVLKDVDKEALFGANILSKTT